MPGLSLSCGMHQRQTRRLYFGQRQELSLEQRMEQRQEQLEVSNDRYLYFLHFVTTVWGHTIQPSARCPKCNKGLMVAEIVIGFKTDVNDFTTACPQCKHRFEPTNLVSQRTGEEYRFWCNPQTRERLPGLEGLEVDDFRKQHPHIYFSAIFHFGSLFNAFRHVHIEYRREKFDWTTKARFCLGQVSDKDISAIFGVSVAKVSTMRKSLKIERYRGKGSVIPANWQHSLSA